MNIVPTNITIADFCRDLGRGEIIVNRDYQRSDKVWPPRAQSFLIETIILGFPLPKMVFYQITDIKSRKTYKEIVDGQQRTFAILAFFEDRLRLSPSLETKSIAGRTYSELEDADKQRFLDSPLALDVLVASTRDSVREAFRRINSYTVPLNAEEHRHAIYQGPFKWFIQTLTKQFNESFIQTGLFSEKQLVRMADTKLLAEICHALANGIRTTSKASLDRLYKDRNITFPEERDWTPRLTKALDQLRAWPDLHHGPFTKPFLAYSLLLGLIHLRKPVPSLEGNYPSPRLRRFDSQPALANLTRLAAAIEDDDQSDEFAAFVAACTSKTNVRNQRETRFTWVCRAIAQESL